MSKENEINLNKTITNITDKLKKSQIKQRQQFNRKIENQALFQADTDLSMALPQIGQNQKSFNTMITTPVRKKQIV